MSGVSTTPAEGSNGEAKTVVPSPLPPSAASAPTSASLPASPHLRLLAGLGLMLALFLAYGIYTLGQMRQLRQYQRRELERSRRDTLQLLRIQEDAYELTLAVSDMVSSQPRVPLPVWRANIARLRRDMAHALHREAAYAPAARGADERAQLLRALAQFWNISHQAFHLSSQGFAHQAADLVKRELAPQGSYIHNLIARWMDRNARTEARTEAAMQAIYGGVSRKLLWLEAILLALAAAIAVWVVRAHRASFAQVRRLAQALDERSHALADANHQLLTVQEATLQRIARDLHDELGQLLTAQGLVLARAQKQLPAPASPSAADLQQARKLGQEAQQKIRGLAQLLRPPALDDFGLLKTLSSLADEFQRRTGIETRVEGSLPFVPDDAAIHLYRIVQEALTNVARHAQATQVVIVLHGQGRGYGVQIRDNGRGLDPHAGSGPGLGLAGMRERAQILGGTFALQSQPTGLCVAVEVPG